MSIGYVDDTLIVTEEDAVEMAQNWTKAALAIVCQSIEYLGLRLRTTAVAFSHRVWRMLPRIRLGGKPVVLGKSIKYLL